MQQSQYEKRAMSIASEMLEQRDYKITGIEETLLTADKPDGEGLAVFLIVNELKLRIDPVKDHMNRMSDMNIQHAIIIYNEGITPFVNNFIEQSKKMRIELFSLEDLQYNITKHRLQPQFKRLTSDETLAFKKKYGTKFPIMKRSDPIARFYDYHYGNIIRIERKNGYISYRIVI